MMWLFLLACAPPPQFTWSVLLRPDEAVAESCASGDDSCIRYRIPVAGTTTPECALERASVCVVEGGKSPAVNPPSEDLISREEHLRLLLSNCMFAFPSQELCVPDSAANVVQTGSELYIERVEVRRSLVGRPVAYSDISLGSARVQTRVAFEEDIRSGGKEYIAVGCALSMLSQASQNAVGTTLSARRTAVYHRSLQTTPAARKVDLTVDPTVEPAERLVQWQAQAEALGLWTCSSQ